jgi:hypothetical protein
MRAERLAAALPAVLLAEPVSEQLHVPHADREDVALGAEVLDGDA